MEEAIESPGTEEPDTKNSIEAPNFETPKKGHAFLWVIIILIFVIIIAIIILFFVFRSEKIILGENFELQEGKTASLLYEGKNYKVEMGRVNSDYLEVQMASKAIILRLGAISAIDLDDDGKEDVQIKLVRIENGIPVLRIEEIEEVGNCTENWECGSWGDCINESRSRDCYDKNGCGTENNRPLRYESCSSGSSQDAGEQKCLEKGGKTCGQGTYCSGTLVSASDTSNCCLGLCPNEQPSGQTCSQKGGKVCAAGTSCTGVIETASDASSCCMTGSCEKDECKSSACTCSAAGGNPCVQGQTCPEGYLSSNDCGIGKDCYFCCAGTCTGAALYNCGGKYICKDNQKCVDGHCILKTCSEQNGVSCNNGEKCTDWITSSDKENCCANSCQLNSVSPAVSLQCKNITDVTITGSLTVGQWLSLIASEGQSGGWGQITEEGWVIYSGYYEPYSVSLMPPDNLAFSSGKNYTVGTIPLMCDGVSKSIVVPIFRDISGDGFIDENGAYFDYRIYVASDGSTYYNPQLTILAKQK